MRGRGDSAGAAGREREERERAAPVWLCKRGSCPLLLAAEGKKKIKSPGGGGWSWRPALEVKEEICRNWAKMLVFWLTLDPNSFPPRSSTEILFIGGVRGPYCLYWGNFSALDSTRGIQTVGSKCAPRAAKFGSSRL